MKGSIEEALKDSVFFIEADSFSRHALWVMHVYRPDPRCTLKVDWSGNGCQGLGVSLEGGTHLVCWFDFINDQQVCFYYPTSMRIDWDEINQYMSRFIPSGKKCDAQNFGHCLAAIQK